MLLEPEDDGQVSHENFKKVGDIALYISFSGSCAMLEISVWATA